VWGENRVGEFSRSRFEEAGVCGGSAWGIARIVGARKFTLRETERGIKNSPFRYCFNCRDVTRACAITIVRCFCRLHNTLQQGDRKTRTAPRRVLTVKLRALNGTGALSGKE